MAVMIFKESVAYIATNKSVFELFPIAQLCSQQLQQVRFSKHYDKLSRNIVEQGVNQGIEDAYGEELLYRLRGRRKFWKHDYQNLHAQVFDWPDQYGFMRVRNLLRERPKGDDFMDHFIPIISDPMMTDFMQFRRWERKEIWRTRHRYVWPEKQEAMTEEEMKERQASAKKKKKKK